MGSMNRTRGRIWKQIALGIMTVFLLLGAGTLSEHVSAAKNIASGSYEDTTWVIDKNGKLTVKGSGNVGGFHKGWKDYARKIKKAVIRVKGMTDASNLFEGCENLVSVDLSGFDTSSVTDMYGMFSGCGSLTTLDVSGFDTRNVTDMGSMFSGCSSLTTLDVSGFDTSNVTSMGVMFVDCSSLTTLDVSRFVTSNVTSMGGCFPDVAA